MTKVEQKVEQIVRRLLFTGWSLGKKQVKDPFNYTLGDGSLGKKEYDQLMKLINTKK